MSIKQEKRRWKGLNPDERIEVALELGLSEDRSGIDGNCQRALRDWALTIQS